MSTKTISQRGIKPKLGLMASKSDKERETSIVSFIDFMHRPSPPPNPYLALLGMEPRPVSELMLAVQEGLNYQTFDHFQHVVQLSTKDVAALLEIPPSTLVRRKERGRLGSFESERLLRFSRLFGAAVELFEGDVPAARRWLQTPSASVESRYAVGNGTHGIRCARGGKAHRAFGRGSLFLMLVAWRITKTKRVATAFDGEGARRSGARWNSVGTPMVYTSASVALATLEILVHLEDSSVLPHYSVLPVEFEEAVVSVLDVTSLPENWRDAMAPVALQQIGDAWIKARDSVVLRVPSVIVPTEDNYLLNPRHPDFSALKFGPPQPFDFDSRLFKATPVE